MYTSGQESRKEGRKKEGELKAGRRGLKETGKKTGESRAEKVESGKKGGRKKEGESGLQHVARNVDYCDNGIAYHLAELVRVEHFFRSVPCQPHTLRLRY